MSTEPATPKQRTFLGHPMGLYVLFFTEMWERFSYYGMKALLFVYMLNYLKWEKEASLVYKLYTSFVYVTPIIGGYLADRYLGNRRAVIIGAVLMALGHFLMAFEETTIFCAALIFLIMGNGFFKPNMSTQVGRLYPANDGRRDAAYTIFYMGINLGAFLSPLICGWLEKNTVGGYHSGFTMAGIGMVLGLIIYLFGQPLIREIATPESTEQVQENTAPPVVELHAGPPPVVAGAPPAEAIASGPPPISASPAHAVQAGPPKVIGGAPALTEAEAERTPSVLGKLSLAMPAILYVLGGLLILGGLGYMGVQIVQKEDFSDIMNTFMVALAGGCTIVIGYVASKVQGGVRDRILAMFVLGVFIIFFWAAFEQAGNVHNVWADQFTNRNLTEPAHAPHEKPPEHKKEKKSEEHKREPQGYVKRFLNLFPNMVTLKDRPGEDANQSWMDKITKEVNPIPTAWFQSINAFLIVVFAPLFAWMWTTLARRGWQPSIPTKMAFGVGLMSAAMAVMVAAAKVENQRSDIAWDAPLPDGITLTDSQQLAPKSKDGHAHPFNAGRLTLDSAAKKLVIFGVLDRNVCEKIIESTAPKDFQKKVAELEKESATIDGTTVKTVEVILDQEPPGFDLGYPGMTQSEEVQYFPAEKKLVAYKELAKKEVRGLDLAAGAPEFRDTMFKLYVKSAEHRVSIWWLFWSFLLATLGELCLSPVGLAMVSKLAPARFATMLMGMWLMTSAFANFIAGVMGEIWGTWEPIPFFMFSAVAVGAAALVLLALSKVVTVVMHGVK